MSNYPFVCFRVIPHGTEMPVAVFYGPGGLVCSFHLLLFTMRFSADQRNPNKLFIK